MDNALTVTELIAGQPKYSISLFTAGISRFPTTPGQHVVVLHSPYLFALSDVDQSEVLKFIQQFVQQFAGEVKSMCNVRRCGLAYDGHQCLHIIPMHGLDENCKPMLAPDAELEETYPGYLSTKSGAQMAGGDLEAVQRRLITVSRWTTADHTFHGDDSDTNLFARLVKGEIPQWRISEDGSHLAFLTQFPNVPGATVLIPRRHLSSDIFGLQHAHFDGLMVAARKVVNTLHAGLNIERVGMFFEGYEIDYEHAKFYPILGDREPEGPSDEYHDKYPGYLTSRLGPEEIDRSQLERYR